MISMKSKLNEYSHQSKYQKDKTNNEYLSSFFRLNNIMPILFNKYKFEVSLQFHPKIFRFSNMCPVTGNYVKA